MKAERIGFIKLAQKVIADSIKDQDFEWLNTKNAEPWLEMANVKDTDLKHLPEAVAIYLKNRRGRRPLVCKNTK